MLSETEIPGGYHPVVVHVDSKNKIKSI